MGCYEIGFIGFAIMTTKKIYYILEVVHKEDSNYIGVYVLSNLHN